MTGQRFLPLAAALAASLLLGACPVPVDKGDSDSGVDLEVTGGSPASSTGGTSTSSTGGGSSSTGGSSGNTGGAASSTGGSSVGGNTGGTASATGGMASGNTGGSAMTGTGGAKPPAENPPAGNGTKVPADIATMFAAKCTGCHAGEYTKPDTAYKRLTGTAMGACAAMGARMKAGDGMGSLVVQKLLGTAGCGAKMPLVAGKACAGDACVPMADIMKVITWINDGAKPVP